MTTPFQILQKKLFSVQPYLDHNSISPRVSGGSFPFFKVYSVIISYYRYKQYVLLIFRHFYPTIFAAKRKKFE